jgi:hypothetical protein
MGYRSLPVWVSKKPLTGELLNWCVTSGFASVDIELPDYRAPRFTPKSKKVSTQEANRQMLYALLRELGRGAL